MIDFEILESMPTLTMRTPRTISRNRLKQRDAKLMR